MTRLYAILASLLAFLEWMFAPPASEDRAKKRRVERAKREAERSLRW